MSRVAIRIFRVVQITLALAFVCAVIVTAYGLVALHLHYGLAGLLATLVSLMGVLFLIQLDRALGEMENSK